MNIINEYYLKTIYDTHNSFYKKAKVLVKGNGDVVLRSYATDVALIRGDNLYVKGLYSNTTTRHIREFALQNNFNFLNNKDLMARYNADRLEYCDYEYL